VGAYRRRGESGRTPCISATARGTISGNKVSLSTQVEARRSINGEESVQTLTLVYDFIVDGDKLQGTTTFKGSDMEMPTRPFTAWREAKTGR
jgi:hypothetical protein